MTLEEYEALKNEQERFARDAAFKYPLILEFVRRFIDETEGDRTDQISIRAAGESE